MSPSECAFKDVARDLGRLRPRFRSPDVVILNNAIDHGDAESEISVSAQCRQDDIRLLIENQLASVDRHRGHGIGALISSRLAEACGARVRSGVQDGRFGIVTSVRGLPLGVRDALQALWGSATLDIAEPKGEFQRTDVVGNTTLPRRRMVAAGCTSNDCIVYYERGGLAHTWHVALFHWTPAATRFEWGGTAPAGLKTIDDVRKAILSGAIDARTKSW